jgi:superfamily I DNA/RNA helicase
VGGEIKAIERWLSSLLREGLTPGDIALFARSDALLKARAIRAVEACGIPFTLLKDKQLTVDGVAIGTMHRAKGLEFKAVGVVACDSEVLPLKSVLDSIQDGGDRDSFVEQERNLLYVACSRARERLLISWTGSGSAFLGRTEVVTT